MMSAHHYAQLPGRPWRFFGGGRVPA
jgi:hypothetical protein